MFVNCLNSSQIELSPPSSGGPIEAPVLSNTEQPGVDTSGSNQEMHGGGERRFMSARERKKCLRNPRTIEDLVYSINNGGFDDYDDDQDSVADDEDKSSTDEYQPQPVNSSTTNQFEIQLPKMNSPALSSSSSSSSSPQSSMTSQKLVIDEQSLVKELDCSETRNDNPDIDTFLNLNEFNKPTCFNSLPIITSLPPSPNEPLIDTMQTYETSSEVVLTSNGIKRRIDFDGSPPPTVDNSSVELVPKRHRQTNETISSTISTNFDSIPVITSGNNDWLLDSFSNKSQGQSECNEWKPTNLNTESTLVQLVKLSSTNPSLAKSTIPSISSVNSQIEFKIDQLPTKIQPPPQTASRPKPKNLPDKAVEIMLAWWNQHLDNPFPTESERLELARIGQITATQVRQWFANRRMRASVKKNKNASAKLTKISTSVDFNNNSMIEHTRSGGLIPPNELDKYNESIDFVIKSVDYEMRNREVQQSTSTITNIINELQKMEQHKQSMGSQFPAPKKPPRFVQVDSATITGNNRVTKVKVTRPKPLVLSSANNSVNKPGVVMVTNQQSTNFDNYTPMYVENFGSFMCDNGQFDSGASSSSSSSVIEAGRLSTQSSISSSSSSSLSSINIPVSYTNNYAHQPTYYPSYNYTSNALFNNGSCNYSVQSPSVINTPQQTFQYPTQSNPYEYAFLNSAPKQPQQQHQMQLTNHDASHYQSFDLRSQPTNYSCDLNANSYVYSVTGESVQDLNTYQHFHTVSVSECPCCNNFADIQLPTITSPTILPANFNNQQFKCDTPPPMNSGRSSSLSPSDFLQPLSNILNDFEAVEDFGVDKNSTRSESDQIRASPNLLVPNTNMYVSNQEPNKHQFPSLAADDFNQLKSNSYLNEANNKQPVNQLTFTNIRFHPVPGSNNSLGNHIFSNLNIGAKISAAKPAILTSTKPISISLSQIRSLQQEVRNNESSEARFMESRAKDWCLNSQTKLVMSNFSPLATLNSNNLENHQETNIPHLNQPSPTIKNEPAVDQATVKMTTN